MRCKKPGRRGFTLVELLVVITIIGILIGLLLPAVGQVRESARRTQCANNIKQIANGMLHHVEDQGFFPSGGWGFCWMGDPDRGYADKQPGSFIYNTLPYLDLMNLHELGKDYNPNSISSTKTMGNALAAQTPVPLFSCPTRRRCIAYPCVMYAKSSTQVYNCDPSGYASGSKTNRSDYGCNGGSVEVFWGSGPNASNGYAGQGFTGMTSNNGLGCQQSTVRPDDVTDGATNTYLVGEKHRNPATYATGTDMGDAYSIQTASDYDRYCWSDQVPLPDTTLSTAGTVWGSAHLFGFNVSMCDASVHFVMYTIDPTTHMNLGARNDGATINLTTAFGG